MARSSPVLFDWHMFLLTGAALFLGSFRPNQTPKLARALASLLRMHDPLVNMVVLCGGWVGGSLLAGDRESFLGFPNIWRCSWMSPEDDVDGLNILTLLAGPIALALATCMSLSVMFSSKRWVSSNGSYLGFRLFRRRFASQKHLWGWRQPLAL